MTRKELDAFEQIALHHYNARKGLGNFDANSETITYLCAAVLSLTRHLIKKRKKPAKR